MASNLNEVNAALDNLVDSFAFDKPDPGNPSGKIGDGALDLISQRIQNRDRRQVAPGENDWQPNAEAYAKSKKKAGKPVGVLTGEMLSAEQIDGEREIDKKSAYMTYGKDGADFARRKAQWFTNGSKDPGDGGEPSGATNQPGRKFYALDLGDRSALKGYFSQIFDAVVRRAKRVP